MKKGIYLLYQERILILVRDLKEFVQSFKENMIILNQICLKKLLKRLKRRSM